jgi:hypothetical protein
MTSSGRPPLTAAMRVIDGVHHHTSHLGALTKPATSPCFAQRRIFMFCVANLSDTCTTADMDFPRLTRGQAHLRVDPLAGHQSRCCSRRPNQLSALPFLQFHIVNLTTQWNQGQRQAIARLYIGFRTRHDVSSYLQADGRQNIALFSVPVMKKRNIGRSIWIVLYGGNAGRHAILISPKINQAIKATMTTTSTAHGYTTGSAVTTATTALTVHQWLVRLVGRQLVKRPGLSMTPSR